MKLYDDNGGAGPLRKTSKAATEKKFTRYVLCGLSARAISHFVLPLTGKGREAYSNDFSTTSHLSAVLDVDSERVNDFNAKVGLELACYGPEELERMIRDEKPDVVIIAGPDFTHCDYILRSLQAGCDVIVEKPMVLTSAEAQQVLEAERRTGRRVRVTFNVRYQPVQRAIKQLLQRGVIGRPVNVDFIYNLGTEHGASYFYRWNRVRAKSGGLNIHKCCHHLDLLNWLLEDWPETLFAFGALNYYGPEGALRPRTQEGAPLGLAETKKQCPYFQHHLAKANLPETSRIRMAWDPLQLPYEVQYPASNPAYLYDEEIDIEDTYGVLIRYKKGAIVNYSINFSAAWEGCEIGINGTLGRVEFNRRMDMPGNDKASAASIIRVMPLFGEPYEVKVEGIAGGHQGADELLQRDLFGEISPESEQLQLMAGSVAGAYAVAAGEAIHTAITKGTPVTIPPFEATPAEH